MPKEIERKYIAGYIPAGLTKEKITQGYLQSEKHRTVRIRIVKIPMKVKYALRPIQTINIKFYA